MVLGETVHKRTRILIIKREEDGHYARAGIRTRVDGMKTRNDGPDYTTRAVIGPLMPCS